MVKKKEKTELELLNEISRKLDLLIAAVASTNKERNAQAKLLTKQFKPFEIAEILGTTPNAVRLLLHKSRKRGSVRGRRTIQHDNEEN